MISYIFGFEVEGGSILALPISSRRAIFIEELDDIVSEVAFQTIDHDINSLKYVYEENMNIIYGAENVDDDDHILAFEMFANKDTWLFNEIRKNHSN